MKGRLLPVSAKPGSAQLLPSKDEHAEKAGKVSGMMWLLAVPEGLLTPRCWITPPWPVLVLSSNLGLDPAVENASLV